jgi:hypothetical protein
MCSALQEKIANLEYVYLKKGFLQNGLLYEHSYISPSMKLQNLNIYLSKICTDTKGVQNFKWEPRSRVGCT